MMIFFLFHQISYIFLAIFINTFIHAIELFMENRSYLDADGNDEFKKDFHLLVGFMDSDVGREMTCFC